MEKVVIVAIKKSQFPRETLVFCSIYLASPFLLYYFAIKKILT